MITGSHNPPDYNGFKLVIAGKSVFGDQIQALGLNGGRRREPAATAVSPT